MAFAMFIVLLPIKKNKVNTKTCVARSNRFENENIFCFCLLTEQRINLKRYIIAAPLIIY